MNAFLLMSSAAGSQAHFELSDQSENLLGRDWTCQIVLNDPQCSRVHAAIYKNEEGWWITDRKSSNGTYVNNQLVDTAQLIDGCEIRIGTFLFRFSTQQQPASADERQVDGQDTSTIIFDRNFSTGDFGQHTLDFLNNSKLGQDFYFLFQLSVKLLGESDPNEVIQLCLRRLAERTESDVAGFLWLNEAGQLKPKLVIPEDQSSKLLLRKSLTKRVVLEKHAIRVEYESSDTGEAYADAICVPLVADEKHDGKIIQRVRGVIHLYRQHTRFSDAHFDLACALANIMMRAMNQANQKASLAAQHSSLVQKSAASDELIGESQSMLDLKSKIARISRATGCVLIRGESGVGKELVARAIHRASPRADRPMLTVNCAAIPRELMESQLFGHKKGAFTSADRDHVGWFQQADLGTLFLDEIGELTLEGQAKLLRILEGHPFMPVGSSEAITVDVRVICATNRDLKEFVAEKKFREDLFYRLSVYELRIPPLRDRGTDIQTLVDYFLKHFRERNGRFDLTLSPEANRILLSYNWPGNIRQLRNVLDSAVVMAEGNEIQAQDLGIRDAESVELESLRIDHWEKKLIVEALKRTGGNMPDSAKMLGISRATLYRKLDEYQISKPD